MSPNSAESVPGPESHYVVEMDPVTGNVTTRQATEDDFAPFTVTDRQQIAGWFAPGEPVRSVYDVVEAIIAREVTKAISDLRERVMRHEFHTKFLGGGYVIRSNDVQAEFVAATRHTSPERRKHD